MSVEPLKKLAASWLTRAPVACLMMTPLHADEFRDDEARRNVPAPIKHNPHVATSTTSPFSLIASHLPISRPTPMSSAPPPTDDSAKSSGSKVGNPSALPPPRSPTVSDSADAGAAPLPAPPPRPEGADRRSRVHAKHQVDWRDISTLREIIENQRMSDADHQRMDAEFAAFVDSLREAQVQRAHLRHTYRHCSRCDPERA